MDIYAQFMNIYLFLNHVFSKLILEFLRFSFLCFIDLLCYCMLKMTF